MASKDFIKTILAYIQDNQDKIDFNNNLFEIMEGDLLKYVETALRQQLTDPDSFKIAVQRAAPVNVWNKIKNKLSTLYTRPVARTTELQSDQELIDYYVERGLNRHFGNMNENYNSYKWTDLEIYEDPEMKQLRFRSNPSNVFLAYSDDPINPLRVTAIIKFMGQVKDAGGTTRNRYWIYTEDEFIPILDNESIVTDDLGDTEGVNPYGVIPFQYGSMSEYELVPRPDKDTTRMTILIPVLLTDQNFGSMYLSFPIIYTVDGDAENLPLGPSVFWNLKSDNQEKPATANVLKATPDLEMQMNHLLRQLAMWLESRDIKPGSIGKVSAENFESGISKIISEMDTFENRKRQEEVFKDIEKKFWKRLATMHNVLAKEGRLENRKMFSDPEKLNVNIVYSEEKMIESRADKANRLNLEVKSGLNTRARALREYHSSMEEAELIKLLEEIEKERTIVVESTEEVDGD